MTVRINTGKKEGIEFMQINVTRIRSIRDRRFTLAIRILDNMSARNYARRSRAN